jgi:glutamate-1-semialdehyde aminotransferase
VKAQYEGGTMSPMMWSQCMTETTNHRIEELKHGYETGDYARAQKSLLGGVPMNWMKKWAGKFPVFVAEAHGAHFKDVAIVLC